MTGRNLLVLCSDEHEARTLGCAGHPLARTPNLDRLAARGTRFTRAWTPSPICVPARAALATGRWTHETGYWDNAHGYDGRVRGWGHTLLDAGHRVESIGKLHYRSADDPTGFGAQHNAMHLAEGMGQVWGSVRDPMPAVGYPSPLFDQLGAGESSYNRFDLATTRLAIDWLHARARTPDARPWVLFAGFVAPHFPLVVPQEWLDLFPPGSMPLPPLLPRDGHRRHPWVEANAIHGGHDAALGTDDRRRLALACYFGLLAFIDHQIGRVLAALEETGLAASTNVLYTSDHGDNQGKRGMWNKCLLYRESTQVPMILAGPDVPRDRTCATNVSLADVGATALASAGHAPGGDDAAGEARAALPGFATRRSLLDLATAPDDPRRLGFSEYHAIGAPSGAYMVVHGRFKYHHYVGFAPELFDLEADPDEAHDLAADPAHAGTLAACEALLRTMLDPDAVDRRAKDTQNALVARVGGRERALALGPRGATPVPGTDR